MKLTISEFRRLVKDEGLSPGIHFALQAILVNGKTWKEAAATHGVTESGIYRAAKRLKVSSAKRDERNKLLHEAMPHLPGELQRRVRKVIWVTT